MHSISMPPGGLLQQTKDCMVFTDTLVINFTHNGFFGSSDSGLFKPGLPTGDFTIGTSLGSYTPLTNNTAVDLVFIDTDTKLLYVITLSIKSSCP